MGWNMHVAWSDPTKRMYVVTLPVLFPSVAILAAGWQALISLLGCPGAGCSFDTTVSVRKFPRSQIFDNGYGLAALAYWDLFFPYP